MALLIEDDGRVRVLRIDRPDSLNAMNNDVFRSIRDALVAAETDEGVAVVVLTATGDRAFSAGQDLTEMLSGTDGEAHQFPSMLEVVTSFRKPLIAAVNGLGVGIGMTVLAHCDLVLMATNARLRTPFPQLGLAPEAGSSYTFATRMGSTSKSRKPVTAGDVRGISLPTPRKAHSPRFGFTMCRST